MLPSSSAAQLAKAHPRILIQSRAYSRSGLRTEDTKLGVYPKWPALTSSIIPGSVQLEFYDYSTIRGHLVLDSYPGDPRVG
jgi:hypothetical protein